MPSTKAQEIIGMLAGLSMPELSEVIKAAQQRHAEQRGRLNKGQVVVAQFKDGPHLAVVTGGGRNLRVWRFGTDLMSYYTVSWDSILDVKSRVVKLEPLSSRSFIPDKASADQVQKELKEAAA